MKKLNLGCGQYRKEGYVNVDWFDGAKYDVKHNLNSIPYPFEDNEFDLIESSHSLEHLEKVFDVMKEIHRIAKPGAIIKIWVPHFSRGFTHAQHEHGFDFTFPLYFNPDFNVGYMGYEFELIDMKMRWFCQPAMKKIVLPPLSFYTGYSLGLFIDFFANLSNMFCSRIWCFWVGGFEEINFKLKVIKKGPGS